MSQSLSYTGCDVEVHFKNKEEMDKQIKAFEKEVEQWDTECQETDYCNGNPTRAYVSVEDNDKLSAYVCIDDDGETWINDEKLVELICKHFPTANGTVGYANVDLRHGFCTYASGGEIQIKDGKVVPSTYQQLQELRKDFDEALEYISMVVSNGDITDCGVSHLFKKYYPEDYKQALEDKGDK